MYPRQSLKGLHGDYEMVVEARDELGYGPHSDEARILIKVQAINSYRPVFIMPALSNASVELQEVRELFTLSVDLYRNNLRPQQNLVKANYLVMTVKATDNDTGDNGKIGYHLQVKYLLECLFPICRY